MSLLIISLAEDRALVAVDTVGRFPGGSLLHVTKLFPLPHIGAVLASRGVGGILAGLVAGQCNGAQTFEAAHQAVVAHMPKLAAMVQSLARQGGMHGEVDQVAQRASMGLQELALIGWSDDLGRMAGGTFSVTPGYANGLVVAPLDPGECVFAPGGVPELLPDPDTPENALAIARWQVEHWSDAPDACPPIVGGDLIVAQLQRDALTMTRHRSFMGRLPEPSR